MAGDVTIETRCLLCSEDTAQCSACAVADAPNPVVGIFDRKPVTTTLIDRDLQPQRDEVIEILEDLLQRARAGEFTALAAVLNGPDAMVTIATTGAIEENILICGGLSRVAHLINMGADCDEV